MLHAAYVGRYAPSPTGDLHLGNALAAVLAWGRGRRAGGRVLLRIEDLDTARVVVGAAARITADLRTLGLQFDEDVLVQSQHLRRYHDALDALRALGLVYACSCSRKELASAPHAGEDGPPYPGTCRDKHLDLDAGNVAWRFKVPAGRVVVDDRLQGRVEQDVAQEVGDFVLRRKDGIIAYQLAVVVDDAYQGITEVVRGADLLASSARQVLLHRALRFAPPAFAHVPLWVGADGHRLSKRSGDDATLLRTLFARGESGERVLGRIGYALGVCGANDNLSASVFIGGVHDAMLRRATISTRESLEIEM